MAVDVATAPVEDADPHAAPSAGGQRWLLAGLVALLSLPLIVGVIALRRPSWFPVLDLAMTELRLRDVGTSHTPLIGLPGRIGTLAEQGSHPGPLSFYVLTPTYRLLGSSAWAMQAATVVLDVVALSLAVWIASRRGGRPVALALAALLALLTAGYGVSTLTEPWNPYMPVLWWIVLLLAVWSVLAGDLPMVPVAVFAASFCAQTHVPYLGLAGGLGLVMAIALGVRCWRASGASRERRRVARWTAAGAGLGALLWLPPVIDHVTNDPSNASIIADSLGTPDEPPVGMRQGMELALLHLDVAAFVTGDGGASGSLVDASSDPDGSLVPGLVTVTIWLVAAAWTARHRREEPVPWSLHLVVAAALAFGVVSMSRIYGKIWYYLMLWAWGTAALLLLAVGWTVAVAVRSRMRADRRAKTARAAALAGVAILGASTAGFTIAATDAPPPAENLSLTLGRLLPDTVAALEGGDGAAVGRDGRYLVMWTDAFYFGSQGFGLVSELERRGFDARGDYPWRVPLTRHRVVDPDGVDDTDAAVILATGVFVDRWRAVPGVQEVAFVEPRDARQRAEFDRLHDELLAGLDASGADDLMVLVDENLFGLSLESRLPEALQDNVARMLELGQPTAIFVAPPGAHL